MNAPTPPPAPADLIAEYVWLRNNKQAKEKEFEEWLRQNYTQRMEEIEEQILTHLNIAKVDSVAARGIGTAYRKRSVSVTVADMNEFRRHVIGTEQWDLADWRAQKTVITDMVDAGDPVPPGVNFSTRQTIGIRKG